MMSDVDVYKLLIIWKDQNRSEQIKEILHRHFNVLIDSANDQKKAEMLLDYHAYDLILFDLEIDSIQGDFLKYYATASFLNQNTATVFFAEGSKIEFLKERSLSGHSSEIMPVNFSKTELVHLLKGYFRSIDHQRHLDQVLENQKKDNHKLRVELKKTQENFINIVERSSTGILIVDHQRTIRFVNREIEHIFLRSRKELLGFPFGFIVSDDSATQIDIVRKNGEIGTGEMTMVATEWQGHPANLVIINDVTRHIQLQENLQEAMQKVKESDMLKTAFLANMSHEIRTPLNGILGFSQLLNERDIKEEARHSYLNSIINSGYYLMNIINDIVDIAQIESGQLEIFKTTFDLVHMFNELLDMFIIHDSVKEKELQIKMSIPKVDSFYILSDGVRVRQIMINLITNAIKYTEKGSVTFGFELTENKMTRFLVEDTGTGIPPEEHTHIFERFIQLKNANGKISRGTGLGLSISKALVELLGGDIGLESVVEKGTTFYFSLPQNVPAQNGAKGSSKQEKSHKEGKFQNKKILIVEDEDVNFNLIKEVVKNYETIIYRAVNGVEAVEIASNEEIDLILMDIKLPVKNGFEAVQEIRKLKPDIPIIAQTAYAMTGDNERMLKAGVMIISQSPL